MIKMKSLRSFGLRNADEGKVRRGREFRVANERRARDLEDAGLAFRLGPEPTMMETRPAAVAMENKAAADGPFDLAGGVTGAENPAPSSPAVRPRRKRRSSLFGKEGSESSQ